MIAQFELFGCLRVMRILSTLVYSLIGAFLQFMNMDFVELMHSDTTRGRPRFSVLSGQL